MTLFLTTSNFNKRSKENDRRHLLDLDIGAGGVPRPAPLKEVGTLGTGGDLEASTAGTTVFVGANVAVPEVEIGNVVLQQLHLGVILAVLGLGKVDMDREVGMGRLGMVLGRPAGAEGIADGGDGHAAELAAVSSRDRAGTALAQSCTDSGVTGRGGVGVIAVLKVVARGPDSVVGAEGPAESDREATGVTGALASLVGPVLLTLLVELPVNAVNPRVSLSLGSVGGEDSQGGDDEDAEGRLENHDDVWNVGVRGEVRIRVQGCCFVRRM